MADSQDTIQILIDVRSRLDELTKAQAGFGGLSKEAASAAKTAGKEMDALSGQVDHMAEHVSRRFQTWRLAEAVMAGFGFGSGMQLVEVTIRKWIDLFQDQSKAAAAAAKSIADLNTQYHELSQQTFESGLKEKTPEYQLLVRQSQLQETKSEIRDLSGKIADLQADLAKISALGTGEAPLSGTTGDPLNGKYGYGHTMKDVGETIAQEIEKITLEQKAKFALINSTRDQIKALQKGIAADDKEEVKVDQDDVAQGLQMEASARAKVAEEAQKQAEEIGKLAEKYELMADPSLKFDTEIAEINALFATGAIDADTYAKALDAVYAGMAKEMNAPLEKIRNEMFSPGEKIADREDKRKPKPEGLEGGAAAFANDLGTTSEQAAAAMKSSLGATVSGISDGIM